MPGSVDLRWIEFVTFLRQKAEKIALDKALFLYLPSRNKLFILYVNPMNLRQYLTIMGFATILCYSALGMVLFNIDPFRDETLGLVFFFVTAFFSLLGTFSVISFFLYHWFSEEDIPMYRFVQRSFRNGVVASIIILSVLFLQFKSLLNIWTGGLFALIVLSFILFSLSTRGQRV